MTMTVDVVTGAGSGIGRALARELAADGHAVVGVGRQEERLAATGDGLSAYTAVVADLGEPAGRDTLLEALAGRSVRYLIHNAGRLDPVGDLAAVSPEDWRRSFAVNVDAPLFLTQALLPVFTEGARIVHISSGAAHRAVRGWGTYCATKATLYMIYRLLADELAERGIAVGSVRPGVVDTPMQEAIRALPEARFPDVERFRQLKRDNALVSPEEVATFVHRVLTTTDAERFSRDEWDIREHAGLFR